MNDAQSILVQNTGDAPLDIQSVRVTGSDPGDFPIAADGCTGAHLLPGGICSLNLRFAPAAPGARSASLMITDGSGSPHAVPLAGGGTAPDVSLSAVSLSFGDQPVGTSGDAQSATLTNSGSAPLKIYSVVTSGADPGDFPLGPDPAGVTLAPGESRAVGVRFKPAAPGSRSARRAAPRCRTTGPSARSAAAG